MTTVGRSRAPRQGDQCAPSRNWPLDNQPDPPASGRTVALEGLYDLIWASQGVRVVVTDYVGMGTPGLHTYMNRLDQAHAVLDAARATRTLVGEDGGTFGKVGFYGHSQGGGAAAAAAEEMSSYAPDLDIAGAYASAPARRAGCGATQHRRFRPRRRDRIHDQRPGGTLPGSRTTARRASLGAGARHPRRDRRAVHRRDHRGLRRPDHRGVDERRSSTWPAARRHADRPGGDGRPAHRCPGASATGRPGAPVGRSASASCATGSMAWRTARGSPTGGN